MKKFFIIVRNIILGLIMVVYFLCVVLVSTLLLNKNEYGMAQFDDRVLIAVDKEISSKNYPYGSLVIVEEKKLNELKVGDEIFIYQPNTNDNSMGVIISEVESVNLEAKSPYVTITNNGTAWGEEFIAGVKVDKYDKVGSYLKFFESKWIFFTLLIIPCLFILIYEVYLLISAIKNDDEEDNDDVTTNDNLEELTNVTEEKKEEVKEEEIEDLMAQLESLRKEYDDIEQQEQSKELIVPESTGVLPVVQNKVEEDTKILPIEVINEEVDIVEEIEKIQEVIKEEPIEEVIEEIKEETVVEVKEEVKKTTDKVSNSRNKNNKNNTRNNKTSKNNNRSKTTKVSNTTKKTNSTSRSNGTRSNSIKKNNTKKNNNKNNTKKHK